MDFMLVTFGQDFRVFTQMLISTGAKEIWLSMIVWLTLLFLPMKFCDRRDIVAGWTYAACLTALGTIQLTICLAEFPQWRSPWMQVSIILFMGSTAAVRWFSKHWGNTIEVRMIEGDKGGRNGK